MIKLNNITFSYGDKKVIENFSLNIGKSERICIYGKSGCGKTTLLRLILGLEKPQSGEIMKTPDLKASAVFQENRLLPQKTVFENVKLTAAEGADILSCLETLGIKDYANKKPAALSGGMNRRVAIARALLAEFDYLVLDEPFAGLDEKNTIGTANYIDQIAGERPIILVTHSLAEAELLKCKVICLDNS